MSGGYNWKENLGELTTQWVYLGIVVKLHTCWKSLPTNPFFILFPVIILKK